MLHSALGPKAAIGQARVQDGVDDVEAVVYGHRPAEGTMNPESLRPLFFGVLLAHPPVLHSDKKLRELFHRLGAVHEFSQYEQQTEGTAQFRRTWRGTNERLACAFQKDQVEVVHEFPSTDLQGFWLSARDILKESVASLAIPVFVVQQYLIRKIASPLAEADARLFLSQRVCSIEEKKLQVFGRPLHGVGLRFFFPASKDMPFEYNVKVESLLNDPTQLFLENTAKFYAAQQTADLNPLKKNLEATEEFLSQTVVNFLRQYNP